MSRAARPAAGRRLLALATDMTVAQIAGAMLGLSRSGFGVDAGLDLGRLYDLYAERIAEFAAAPPPPDWDNVYVATSKH